MDNKDLHPEEGFFPGEASPASAGEALPQEFSPVIEELTFQPEPPAETPLPQEAPADEDAPDLPEPETDLASAQEPDAFEETTSSPTDIFQGLPLFQAEPDEAETTEEAEVPAQAEDTLEHALLEQPDLGQELTADDQAMDFHGILNHGEEEPPFDPALLEDPALEETPVPAEEVPAASAAPQEELLPEPPQEDETDQEYRDNSNDFTEIFEAAPAKSQTPAHHRPTRKGRPQRKKGEGLLGIPNILSTFVWLALILAIGVTAGRMLWVCAADVLAFGREDKPVTVTIYEADDMASITDKLYNAGLIRYKSLFNLYATISDAEEDIKPGIYDLNTLYDYHALVNFMSPRSSREVIELTIPEGYTCRQIFELLEENRVCTAVDAANYAANGELNDYWFLEGVARGSENCLEGYLFPDTYEFYKNSTPREALQRMLNNFEIKFTEEMRAQIETLNANVTGGGYTVQDVVIVASLIEKESAGRDESDEIAGVIYNRLFRWDGVPAYLNIDAAIIYAQDGDAEHIDTSLDSPYNTYLNVGLTPGPIANPGLSSLQAALNPASHNYYYYVLNPATGMHQFSTTQEEHNAYIAQFYSE